MWVVFLVIIFAYFITGIMSNLINIAKLFMEKENKDECKCKHKKYKLEE